MAYSVLFRGGVRVISADLTGDGVAEIITIPASHGRQLLRVFNRWGDLHGEFYQFGDSLSKNLNVTAASGNKYYAASIVINAGEGAGPQVKVFNFSGSLKEQFSSYDKTFRVGIHIDVGDVNEHSNGNEIVAVPTSHGGRQIRAFYLNGRAIRNYTAFELWWRGRYDIGAGSG